MSGDIVFELNRKEKRRPTVTALSGALRRGFCCSANTADDVDWGCEQSVVASTKADSLTSGTFHHENPLDFGLHPSMYYELAEMESTAPRKHVGMFRSNRTIIGGTLQTRAKRRPPVLTAVRHQSLSVGTQNQGHLAASFTSRSSSHSSGTTQKIVGE
jgi:hypothetical protein